MDISLSRLVMNDGKVVMRQADGRVLVALDKINLTSSAQFVGDRLGGSGEARVETLNLADRMFVRPLRAPIQLGADQVRLAPLSGVLAEGSVGGSLTLKLSPAFGYAVELQVEDSDVAKLLQEARTKPTLTGKLRGSAKLEGTGGLDTMVGSGQLEIIGGQLQQVPLFELLATVLQVPALREIKFEECRVEFAMADNQMPTPVIRVTAPKIQLTGSGVVALSDYSLNHNLTLALEKSMLEQAPKEIRAALAERADGYLTLDFKLTGPYDHPRTDIPERLLRGAAEQLIEKGLEKLLK